MGKKRKSYSGAFKAKVLRELLNGRGDLKELAERYQLHPNQIKNWKSLLLKRASLILDDKRYRWEEGNLAAPVHRDPPSHLDES